MKRISKIIIVACIVVILAALFGLYRYNQPIAKTGHRPVDHETTSIALFTEFEADEMSSNEKYLDKVIKVSGTINEIQKEDDGSMSIILDGGGMLFGVSCRFEKEQTSTVENLETGNEITIKGICTGMLSDVVLIRCVLENENI